MLLRFSSILILPLLLMLMGCSSESTTLTSKAFHNTTAHYNGYFYAADEIKKIENTIRKNHKDDYNKVLRLFPPLDSVLAASYDKEIQEVVKMASVAIQRHPNSKWVDDSYNLVGKARLYSLDWGNAIQTFKYVNTKGKDTQARHQALLLLARTFTEHGEFNNAEATFDYLAKEKLNKANRKNLYLEKAYHYQVRENDDLLVQNLSAAVPLLTKKDRPGRIYFILGQVYQKLGFEAEAYNFFKECLQTHPEYEVDFYARLYMAQVTEISRSRDIANARKSFRKLLKDSKNKEFKDKIYYEMGVFERKQDNINEALTNYKLAVKEGSSKQIDGEAYLQMGEIYYDTLRKFEIAKLYYDSAVASLNKDFENYAEIKARQEILSEFVSNLKIIEWQDSLFVLAKMDSAALMAHIQSVFDSKKTEEKSSKKKKRNRIEINQVSTSFAGSPGLENTDWYFGNPSALTLGQQEFRRVWGTIPLEDNWRRSSRSTPITGRPVILASGQSQGTTESNTAQTDVKKDPVLDEFTRIRKEIPKTEEQVSAALEKIENAYFALGDIYYFKLQEKENAVASYEKLISRFPETPYRAEVLYKLYLIFKESNPGKSEFYAQELKRNFPESSFARILINPDYLLESSQVLEKQKALYKTAYQKFSESNYAEAMQLVDRAMAMEKSSFYPNLEILRILIIGKTESVTRYQYELDEFINHNATSPLTDYAKKLLTISRDFVLRQEKEQGIKYSLSFDSPHYFVIAYNIENKLEDIVSSTITSFNQANFKDLHLKVSNLQLNTTYSLTLVTDIASKGKALEYYRTFIEKQGTLNAIKNHKFNSFVITKDNFDIFYRTKGLNEYIQFFEKNYRPENP